MTSSRDSFFRVPFNINIITFQYVLDCGHGANGEAKMNGGSAVALLVDPIPWIRTGACSAFACLFISRCTTSARMIASHTT
jgi:hypothetical protein